MIDWNEWILKPSDHNPYKDIWFWLTFTLTLLHGFFVIGLMRGWIP